MVKNCNFGEAIECIKQGGVASREGWNGKGQYISLGVNITYQNFYGATITAGHDTMHSKAIIFHGTAGIQVGWLASQADMLSEDWCIRHLKETV